METIHVHMMMTLHILSSPPCLREKAGDGWSLCFALDSTTTHSQVHAGESVWMGLHSQHCSFGLAFSEVILEGLSVVFFSAFVQ